MTSAYKILVVEDSKVFANLLKSRIEVDGNYRVSLAMTMAEAKKILSEENDFFLGLLDLNLPDSPQGEIVDVVQSFQIPIIVFTGEFDDNMREQILSKGIIDYVFKESSSSIDYVISMIHRITRNRFIKALVVDDSKSSRQHQINLLALHMYQVMEASNGQEALKILEKEGDVRLVLTDYNMPEMDGFSLIKRIRARFSQEELVIIGLSAYGNNLLSTKFIKNGANDFINKPFLSEEFFCRVTVNMNLLEKVRALNDAVIRDFLTGLNNRRYFFEAGKKLFSSAKRQQIHLTTAMLDIDHFKKINDTYGHDVGDLVLKQVAMIAEKHFRTTDIVARMGGEEFAILAVNLSPDKIEQIFDQLRQFVAEEEIMVNDKTIKVTISIGVAAEIEGDLETTLAMADTMLYKAKNGGRNTVVYCTDDHPEGIQVGSS
ncbi:MAG: diguanylate cyclase [Magnetococcales bacterium]|nr:diguanylate cyclase [Magnetococcales bacterium]NGZ28534.1 diguanylate cyclase [Magnetococcales bacterium]